ncbi:DNA repair protein RecN, partial [Streptococcus suis]
DNSVKEYNLLTGNTSASNDLELELKKLEKELIQSAKLLSDKRHELAKVLEAEIKQELTELYMEKADFKV